MTAESTQSVWRWDRGAGGIWTLWFDQPGKSHNLLTPEAFEELDARLAEVEEDASVRGVLVRSAKEAGFCAGADLHFFENARSAAEVEGYLRRGLEVFDRLSRLDPPTTAVVHGVCLGGGFELALACQHRVALASHAALQIGSPEIHFGLIPGWGAIERLSRLLTPKDALDLLLYGDPIGFLHAKSQGVVARLVTQDETQRLAETLDLPSAQDRPFDAETWKEELEFARLKLEQHAVEFPEACEAIFHVVEVDLAEGPEAAREAAVRGMVALALGPDSKDAIAEFFLRSRD